MPRGTLGELRVRGATSMHGYWNKPEQTAEILKDGWVHTGDGGYMDEDGFIYIVDRVKDGRLACFHSRLRADRLSQGCHGLQANDNAARADHDRHAAAITRSGEDRHQ